MVAKKTTEILRQLRHLFHDQRHVPIAVHACIVPGEDAHQSEYIADCDRRIAFLSGFEGSRALVAVTEESAALWTDGRYFVQAGEQMDNNWLLMKEGIKTTPSLENWLIQQLAPSSVIAVDASLISEERFSQIERKLSERGLSLVSTVSNLVDVVWADQRPSRPHGPLMMLDDKLTGVNWQSKVDRIRGKMVIEAADVLLISQLDEIAWLFNLRGNDIVYNPVFFAYAVVTMDRICLFVHQERINDSLHKHLPGVELLDYDSISAFLNELSSSSDCRIWMPSATTSHALANLSTLKDRSDRRISSPSPIALMKAVKNAVELQGMRDAHIRDGAAHCEFLYWLEKEMAGHGDHGLTEVKVADRFEHIRKQYDRFVSLSFATISAVGSHSAMPHYHPTPETDIPLSRDQLYLVDSGAQYRDGTTDVTRTIAFNEPSAEQKTCNTLVLKGHIQLARQLFPDGTNGMRLDSITRLALWHEGLDYAHGTGHGVGHFLNVHEGPMGIGYRALRFAEEGLSENNVITIEPGFYKEGHFGIRIENVYVVIAVPGKSNGFGRFLTFEALTWVPIQKKLLDASLLNADEIAWLNNYHEQCLKKVRPLLESEGKMAECKWLEHQCQPLD